MDIDEYYFQYKHNKPKKSEGVSRTKGLAIHPHERTSGGRHAKQYVTKVIKTTKDWDANRINEYCQNVLRDEGLEKQAGRCRGSAPFQRITYTYECDGRSMNKQKRWKLSKQIRRAIGENDAKNVEVPSISLVESARTRKKIPGSQIRSKKHVKQQPEAEPRTIAKSTSKIPANGNTTKKPKLSHTGSSRAKNEKGAGRNLPEVTYEFFHVTPGSQYDAKRPKEYFYKGHASKKAGYCEEIDEYMNDTTYELECPDEEFENTESNAIEDEEASNRSTDVSLDQFIASTARRKKPRRPKFQQSKEVGNAEDSSSKKGKVVNISKDKWEVFAPESKEVASRIVFSVKVPKTTMEEFTLSQKSEVLCEDNHAVSFANVRPIAFVADLRPSATCNDIKQGYCHLLFETDFDPDSYEKEGLQNDFTNFCKMDISLFCSNGDVLKEFQEKFKSVIFHSPYEENSDNNRIESIIFRAKEIVAPKWRSENYFQFSDTVHHPGTESTSFCCDTKKEHVASALKNMAEHLGIVPEYSSLSNENERSRLQKEDENDELAFEYVIDSSSAEYCRICCAGLRNGEEKGMALASCGHWFCWKCWTHHVTTTHDFYPKCLEADCTESANFFAKMIMYDHAQLPKARFQRGALHGKTAFCCPVSTCNGVTKVPKTVRQPSMLTCACGFAWCADCGGDVHWPASCRAVEIHNMEIAISNRKSIFEMIKNCTYCASGEQMHRWYGYPRHWYNCSHRGHRYSCWRCLGWHFFHHQNDSIQVALNCAFGKEMRVLFPHILDFRRVSKDEYLKSVIVLSVLSVIEAAEAHVLADKKHTDALKSDGIIHVARSKARAYFGERCDPELMTIIEDLILVKNQLHLIAPYVNAAARLGDVKKSSIHGSTLRDICKKIESLTQSMEWLLLKRDYKARDDLFPRCYKEQTVKGRLLIKRLFQTMTEVRK